MTGPVLILGTSGFAIELAAVVRDAGMSVVGFIGPEPVIDLPAPYLGTDADLKTVGTGAGILVAVGKPSARRRIFEVAVSAGRRIETFVSPLAYLAADAKIYEGCIIYPNATVHGRVVLERGVLVNSNASIGHETQVGAFADVGPGVALGGRCNIGEGVYLGIGSAVIENLSIAAGAVIGAGAVVVRNIQTAGTFVGVPARPIS